MLKFLPILIFIPAIISIISLTPLKRELAYNLGLSGDNTSSCCNENEILKSTGEFDEQANVAIFENQVVDYPKTSLAQAFTAKEITSDVRVLGTTTTSGEEKWIEVSIGQQKLRAWEGNKQIMEFPISSGKWAPTPKGNYNIWYKTRSQAMKGGSRNLGTYYYLPNVPHNMFFYKGYAIHGAYWHNNFGNPMSHGCVNAPLDKVGALFEWTGPVVPQGTNVIRASAENPGTRVFIH